MKTFSTFFMSTFVFALLGLLGTSSAAFAAEDDKPKAADNTAINKRDKEQGELTADQQKQNKSDLETTAKIRRAVVKDETLSTNAHNVKIITVNGTVTLKGPVKSDAEKATVEKLAKDVAGEKNVIDQIDIVQ